MKWSAAPPASEYKVGYGLDKTTTCRCIRGRKSREPVIQRSQGPCAKVLEFGELPGGDLAGHFVRLPWSSHPYPNFVWSRKNSSPVTGAAVRYRRRTYKPANDSLAVFQVRLDGVCTATGGGRSSAVPSGHYHCATRLDLRAPSADEFFGHRVATGHRMHPCLPGHALHRAPRGHAGDDPPLGPPLFAQGKHRQKARQSGLFSCRSGAASTAAASSCASEHVVDDRRVPMNSADSRFFTIWNRVMPQTPVFPGLFFAIAAVCGTGRYLVRGVSWSRPARQRWLAARTRPLRQV